MLLLKAVESYKLTNHKRNENMQYTNIPTYQYNNEKVSTECNNSSTFAVIIPRFGNREC
jgi:hypothetical protein